MDNVASVLREEMAVEQWIKIPGLGGINESVVVTWIIMAVLLVIAFWLTRGLKTRNPGKKQMVAEAIVTWLDDFTGGLLGEHALQYRAYLGTVLVYIAFANLSGIFGVKPPTKDFNVTVALALASIILIEASGIRAHKPGGWLKSFTKPIAIVTPINILEIAIRPLSLCMRLYGNVLGAFVIMKLIEMILPVGLPVVFSLYFDIFDGCIQAYVFVFLTSLFIAEKVE